MGYRGGVDDNNDHDHEGAPMKPEILLGKRPLQKALLAVAGITALVIGSFIMAAPLQFYAGYGISPAQGVDLLSELRAPGANLAALGILILAGFARPAMARTSLMVAGVVFLAFAAGRMIGLVLDGMPSPGILVALLVELAIGLLCAMAFILNRAGTQTPR